jgi:hypothetical protein
VDVLVRLLLVLSERFAQHLLTSLHDLIMGVSMSMPDHRRAEDWWRREWLRAADVDVRVIVAHWLVSVHVRGRSGHRWQSTSWGWSTAPSVAPVSMLSRVHNNL